MALYRATHHIPASPARVWEALCDWEATEDWMVPPTTVEVMGEQREGVGTRIRAVSTVLKVLRLIDHMVVTNWIAEREIRTRHVGWMVRGDGIFRMHPEGEGTRFEWIEDFAFPLGPVGEIVGTLLRPFGEWFLRRSCARLEAYVAART